MTNGIKTSEKNYVWTIMRREGKEWRRVVSAIHNHRSEARQAVRGLNAPYRAKRQLHRYKVAKMVIAPQKG